MFGLTRSRISFFHHTSPTRYPLDGGTGFSFSREIQKIFTICFSQSRKINEPGFVPLTSAGKEILLLKNNINHAERSTGKLIPVPPAMPLHAFLELCEMLLMLRAGGLSYPQMASEERVFFVSCGWRESANNGFVYLQSYLRCFLACSNPSNQLVSNGQAIFEEDFFWINEKTFFEDFFNGFSSYEMISFKNVYLDVRQRPTIEEQERATNGACSLHFLVNIVCSTIGFLWAVEDSRDMSLRFSKKFISFLMHRLEPLATFDLMHYFVIELFKFTGLFIENFSVVNEADNETPVIMGMANFSATTNQYWCWTMPLVEWSLRFRNEWHFSAVDICRDFLASYNPTGRDENFPWPNPPITHLRETDLPLFQPMFTEWLVFCRSKIVPFVQAHDHLTSLQMSSLSRLSSLICLESEAFSSFQKLHALQVALRDYGDASAKERMNSCVSSAVLFSQYPLQEDAKKCIQTKMQSLREYMDSDQFHSARACLIFLLELAPYCESSFFSFARVEVAVKLVLSALNDYRSSSTKLTSSYLFSHLIWILSSEALASLQVINKSPYFWKSVIELFRYSPNEDEAGPSSAKKMRLSSL